MVKYPSTRHNKKKVDEYTERVNVIPKKLVETIHNYNKYMKKMGDSDMDIVI